MPKTNTTISDYASTSTEDIIFSSPSTYTLSSFSQTFKKSRKSKKAQKTQKQKKNKKKTQPNYIDQLLNESSENFFENETTLNNWKKLDEKFTNLIEAAEELTS